MTDTTTPRALVERLRKAEGSEILPTVLLGMHNAETTCLHAADALAAALDEVERLRDSMQTLHDDMLERAECKMDTIRGEEYRIVNAGNGAWMKFCKELRGTHQ